jgi:general nucleoside transport system permease protein
VIGGEGALVLGGLAVPRCRCALPLRQGGHGSLCCWRRGGAGAAVDRAGRRLRQYRGVNETISSLLLGYVAIACSSTWWKGRCATRRA